MTVSADTRKTGVISLGAVQEAALPQLTALLVGDSITAQNNASSASTAYAQNIGPFNWANALMGQRLSVVANAGVSGRWITGADGMAGAIHSLLGQYPSGYVVLLAGTNDIANSVSYADIVAGFETIFDACQARGRVVLASTILPRASAGLTAAQRQILYAVNAYLRGVPLSRSGVVMSDPFKLLADPTSSTGDPIAADFYDSPALHPGPSGAMKIASVWAADWGAVLPPSRRISPCAGDAYNATNNPLGFMNSNAHVQTLSATSGTGYTGNNPNSFTIQRITGAGTWTGSAVARTDTAGNWYRAAITGESNAAAEYQIRCSVLGPSSSGTTYAIGDTVCAEAEVKVSHSGSTAYVKSVQLILQEYDRDNTSVFLAQSLNAYTGSNPTQRLSDYTATLRTPNFVTIGSTGSGTTQQRLVGAINVLFDGSITADLTVDIGSIIVRKVV